MSTFTLDIYKDWSNDQLKQRCGELCRAVDKWQHIAMVLTEHGVDGLTPEDRNRVIRLIEAYSD